MALSFTGALLSKLVKPNIVGSYFVLPQYDICQKRQYAARKGTREKARKKKIKVEVKKIGFIPHNQRGLSKLQLNQKSKRSGTSGPRGISEDNVIIERYYALHTYSLREAIQCHRETHHPSMYNVPNAPVQLTIELDMHAEKKTRFVDSFTRTVAMPYPFDHGQFRNVLVLCKTPELVTAALETGADLVGGPELIKQIQTGEVDIKEFKHILCHPNILPEVVSIRGLLKKRFPSPKFGTLGLDLAAMVDRFKRGLEYRCEKNPHEHDLGTISLEIGKLDMELEHLDANFGALLRDIESVKPRRPGDFVTWVWCTSPPSHEKFKIDFKSFIEHKLEIEEENMKQVTAV